MILQPCHQVINFKFTMNRKHKNVLGDGYCTMTPRLLVVRIDQPVRVITPYSIIIPAYSSATLCNIRTQSKPTVEDSRYYKLGFIITENKTSYKVVYQLTSDYASIATKYPRATLSDSFVCMITKNMWFDQHNNEG